MGVGRQRTIMDQHLFLLRGTAEPWAKLIARAVSPEGLNKYKFMKEELFAVLTCTLCIYNIMLGLGREAAQRCDYSSRKKRG